MTKLLLLPIFVLSLSINGQDKSPAKFGKISTADLKTESYNIDKSASAIVLADIGSSRIVGNLKGWFSIEFKRFKRIHIFKESAYDLANVEVLLYSDGTGEEQLKNLKAHTYNLENGNVIEAKLDLKNSVYRSVAGKNHVAIKFAFPAVKVGSIIEYEYTINSDFIFNLQPWKFQENYPVLWSEYNVSIPEFLYYVFLKQGEFITTQTTRQENFRVTGSKTAGQSSSGTFIARVNEYRMMMKSVPAIKHERFISSMENFIAKIEFQLTEYRSPLTPRIIMGDWEDVTKDLLNDERFGGQVKKDNSWLNDELNSLLQNTNLPEEKAKKIFRYLQKNFTCSGSYRLYTEQSLRNVFRDKKGNEAEINLLLVAMLRKCGMIADPVIISTRSNGYTFPNYPIIGRFNYAICRAIINEKPVYLDASRPNLGFGKLHWECYNGHARVINEHASSLQLSPDSLTEAKMTTVMIYSNEKGEIIGNVQQSAGYYESLAIRDKIKNNGLNEYLEEVQSEFPVDPELFNYRLAAVEDLDAPLLVNFDLRLKGDRKDVIYLDPFFGEGFIENPFDDDQRTLPIEMPYTLDEIFIVRIEVPKEYEVELIPQPARINLDDDAKSFFEYLIQNSNGVITLRSRVKVSRSYFLAGEYKSLHDFFTFIVNKQNEKIVFKKNK